ncbi:hypothetical protein [Dactylosporangium sp. CA-233914]|uniref:hypothetical protein n=1 Tax=Dactylosporangium sp. CA-233914 TaxID=3239934 RepID=UPI003D9142BA
MADELQVDVVVESTDPAALATVESGLAGLVPARADTTRDVTTILTVSAAAVALAKGLVELWQTLRTKPNQPKVSIEVESGATLVLGDVQSVGEIEQFVAVHSAAGN